MQRPSYEAGIKEGEKKAHSKILSRLIAKKFNTKERQESPRLRYLTSDDLIRNLMKTYLVLTHWIQCMPLVPLVPVEMKRIPWFS